MNQQILDDYAFQLEQLKQKNNVRQFYAIQHDGRYIHHPNINKKMLNLASNDYLGLTIDTALRQEFLEHKASNYLFSSSSSRLLTGNFEIYQHLEDDLSTLFLNRSALLFNSGYHMNIGILPALCDDKTMILADKWVHASMIDGIRLSGVKFKRYFHQDFTQLERLIQQYQENPDYNKIIIMTESIFSMDGDITDLTALVKLKQRYSKVLLYVDEAHAFGVMGTHGLGCAEQFNVIHDIDFLVGTFGKAGASVGGYLICHEVIKQYLINFMRPLIFSTALPPISIAWTKFILNKLVDMQDKRQRLANYYQELIQYVQQLGFYCPSNSQIIPIILGDNQRSLTSAEYLQQAGFYIMAVRPPTVPQGQARLRICLNSEILRDEFDDLKYTLVQHLTKMES